MPNPSADAAVTAPSAAVAPCERAVAGSVDIFCPKLVHGACRPTSMRMNRQPLEFWLATQVEVRFAWEQARRPPLV